MFAPIELKEFDSLAEMNTAMAAVVKATLEQEREEAQAVMLSGGLTPLPVFEKLASSPVQLSDNSYITYSDDRHVPAESPQSNYGATLPMLRALGIPEDRVIRVQAELPLDEAADAFNSALGNFVEHGAIALALLGIGADGHTCSLFTAEDIERARGHYAIPVRKQTPPDRVSVTPELLRRAERIIFMAAGEEKSAIVDRLLNEPDTVVAGKVVKYCRNVALWRAFK